MVAQSLGLFHPGKGENVIYRDRSMLSVWDWQFLRSVLVRLISLRAEIQVLRAISGLMKIMDGYTARALQAIFPLCAGIGLGMLFHAPYQVFLSALKPREMASGTSAFFLVRFTGATIGLVPLFSLLSLCLSSLFDRPLQESRSMGNFPGRCQQNSVRRLT